ncbi:N-acetylneuraminate synthase [Shivajiella indica]|uniref:N-acetylneuraminate synthase n=1 Tax=Shivajiella indica TaxID=872115 RepID=A0ABW5BG43_9BACT
MSTKHVIVIAEAGVNHNGDINKALELIDVAAEAGADYVKFQTFKAEKIVNPTAQKAAYQKNNMKDDEDTQFGMLKKLEMGEDWYPVLIERCQSKGINFLSTGFDTDSIDFLNKLEIPFYKIPSGEITNKPFLQHIARKGKDVILSTGMATLEEVRAALEVIFHEGIEKDRITVLHCNTEYPTPMEDVNLLAMNQMAKEIGVKVGYSDHTLGIEVPIAAVALGASVIEKHFTLDRNLPGPDHAASLEPYELKAMVQAVRNIEKAISGSGIKEPSPSEQKNKVVARKSLYLRRDMKKGQTLGQDDLIALRPGDGISPMEIDDILGKKLLYDLPEGTKLLNEHLK